MNNENNYLKEAEKLFIDFFEKFNSDEKFKEEILNGLIQLVPRLRRMRNEVKRMALDK